MKSYKLKGLLFAALFPLLVSANEFESDLSAARQVALEFVAADAARDWKKAYDLLWRPAQSLWDSSNYSKYLDSAFQKQVVHDPVVFYISLHPDDPGYAFVFIRSENDKIAVVSILLIREEGWRVVYAEPLLAGALGRRAAFQSLKKASEKVD